MAHRAEGSRRLAIERWRAESPARLTAATAGFTDVCLLDLRAVPEPEVVAAAAASLGPGAVLIALGEAPALARFHLALDGRLRYQTWIAVKRAAPASRPGRLPRQHLGATVYTRTTGPLQHADLRIAYSYCPHCGRTTKDYGGKKHAYHEYGTLLSDVWRDLAIEPEGELLPVLDRFADLFGIEPYRALRVVDCHRLAAASGPPLRGEGESNRRTPASGLASERGNGPAEWTPPREGAAPARPGVLSLPFEDSVPLQSALRHGDCLGELRRLPAESVDFAFADPPYNLGKRYLDYGDQLVLEQYDAWCNAWLAQLERVLKPGRVLAVLNLPERAIRHFQFLDERMQFQAWIAWEALSFPVRRIMPAHYGILCMSKGPARPLPGLARGSADAVDASLQPLAEGYCLRPGCLAQRQALGVDDRGPLTDLWWDLHRVKHNSRRVDHPCQLPGRLLRRLVALFTEPGELVLDPFNGAGTTTLAAQQLRRRYLGIEAAAAYDALARERHAELARGLDPFRKAERVLTAKNSAVRRLPKQKYAVSKKTLQLEVKRIARELGRLPTRAEVQTLGKYPISHYDDYFASWGEACAAARTTGMSERPVPPPDGGRS